MSLIPVFNSVSRSPDATVNDVQEICTYKEATKIICQTDNLKFLVISYLPMHFRISFGKSKTMPRQVIYHMLSYLLARHALLTILLTSFSSTIRSTFYCVSLVHKAKSWIYVGTIDFFSVPMRPKKYPPTGYENVTDRSRLLRTRD